MSARKFIEQIVIAGGKLTSIVADYLNTTDLATSVSGLLKGNGTGVVAASASDLPVFVASGASHAPGAVPDPGSVAGTTRYLREDATWATPSGGGSGDMLANAVNSDNALSNPSSSTTLAANTWNVISATAACTAKLPAPAAKKIVGIRIARTSTNLFTLAPNSSETINGPTIFWAGETAVYISDGTNWFLLDGSSRPMAAVLRLSSVQSINSTTITKVAFDTVDLDNTGLMYDSTNKWLKALRPANYVVILFCAHNGDNAGGSYSSPVPLLLHCVTKNGAGTFTGRVAQMAAGNTVAFNGPASGIVALAAGDYVAGNAYQTSGGTGYIFGAASNIASWFSIEEIPSW